MPVGESSILSNIANILTVVEKINAKKMNKVVVGNDWILSDLANLATVIAAAFTVISVIVAMVGLYFAYQKLTKQMQIFIRQRKIDNLCVDAKEAYEVARKVELVIVEAVSAVMGEPGFTTEEWQGNALVKVVSGLYELKHKLYLLKEIPGIRPELDAIEDIIKMFIIGEFPDGRKFPPGFRLVNGLAELDSNWRESGKASFERIERIKGLLSKIRSIQLDLK